MIYPFRNIITLLCIALMAASCSHDSEVTHGIDPEDDYITVSLTLSIAGNNSRAYDDPLDYDTRLQRFIGIDDVYAVFYDESGHIVMVPEMEALLGAQGDETRTLKGRIPRQAQKLKFRILANVAQCGILGSTPQEVLTQLKACADLGISDDELCAALTFAAGNSEGKWGLIETAHYLPMHSAMSAAVKFEENFSGSLSLYRSVAKIGVEYKSDDNNFVMTKVRVYNQNTLGALISNKEPDPDIAIQFTQPYIPAAASSRDGYVEYNVTDNSLLEEIFVPEFINTGMSATDMHVTVGGYFDGSPNLTWYDMRFTDDGHLGTAPYDVVRNHSYIFRITKVTGNDIEVVLNNAWEEVHDMEIE